MGYAAQNIKHETNRFNELKRRLIEQYPDLEEDQKCLSDTLEGLSNIDELLAELAIQSVTDKAEVETLKNLIQKFSSRQSRIKRRSEKLRDMISEAMLETGIKKISSPVTISIGKGQAGTVITDEDKLPDEYVTIKRVPILSAIKKGFEEGKEIKGAEQTNAKPRLTIKI